MEMVGGGRVRQLMTISICFKNHIEIFSYFCKELLTNIIPS